MNCEHNNNTTVNTENQHKVRSLLNVCEIIKPDLSADWYIVDMLSSDHAPVNGL